MGFLTDLFGGKALGAIGSTLDNIITTKAEKMALENEIHKAELSYKLEAEKLDNERQAMLYKDVESARTRETSIQTSQYANTLGKNISSYLALLATILCFSLFFLLMFTREINSSLKDIIVYILGVLSALLTQIYSYYFGSSSGSMNKQKTIDKILNQ